MSELPVNEIFDTLQGEAEFTGTPATFIRLQFCDVGCPWCDTKYTWHRNPSDEAPLSMIVRKTGEDARHAVVTDVDLCAEVAIRTPRHVVITGGEPCVYDLNGITFGLFNAGKSVQIETSGTREIRCVADTWVTVSPKFNMPGGFKVRDDALARADEIKMPVGKIADVDQVLALRTGLIKRGVWNAPGPTIWLQPLSQSAKATALCVEAATMYGFRVSVQTHRYLGLR